MSKLEADLIKFSIVILPNLFKSIDPDASEEEWKGDESNIDIDNNSEDESSEKSEKDSQQINNSWLTNIVNSLSMITSGKLSSFKRSILFEELWKD